MIKVVPYIKTMGTDEYKKFISAPFNSNFISQYLRDWKYKSMGNYDKFTNENITLEFFPTYYNIKTPNKSVQLPIPKTINDFINDMDRLDIDLFWSDWMEENFEPKHFIAKNEIKKYYKDLLTEIDKGHELLNNDEYGNE